MKIGKLMERNYCRSSLCFAEMTWFRSQGLAAADTAAGIVLRPFLSIFINGAFDKFNRPNPSIPYWLDFAC